MIVIYSNKDYENMIEAFLLSRKYARKEEIPVLYYTVGFDSLLEYPNLMKKRWEIDEKKYNFNFYKPEIILDALTEHSEVIYMDSDILLGKRFDIESLRNAELEYPLCCKGPLEHVWYWYSEQDENGEERIIKCVIENLMEHLNVESRSSSYAWNCMISCNRKCIPFLQEWKLLHEDDTLKANQRFYFPLHDETSLNVLLWKKRCTEQLDLIFFNANKFESFLRVETEEGFSFENRNYDAVYTKDEEIFETCRDSSKVQFYHGMKSDEELKKTLIWMQSWKRPLKISENRLDYISSIIKDMKVGVEIGVFKGQFSRELLKKWNGILYLVDPWRSLGEEYNDSSNHSKHITAFQETMENIQGFEDRAFMIRALSNQAANLFEENSVDFVYIDGNHAYDFVKEDIEIWWPKIKYGGILMGHDYLDFDWYNDPHGAPNGKDKYIWSSGENPEFLGVFGVNPAVDEFCTKKQLEAVVTSEWLGSFIIKKV